MFRRGVIVLLTLTGLLAACGGDGDGSGGSTTAAAATTTAAATTAAATTVPVTTSPVTTATTAASFPRVVGRDWAETTVPAKPTRVVATADRDQLDVLLAMGVKPVLYGFSGDYEVAAPWLDPADLEGVEQAPMPGAFEPNLELTAAARPDLILDAWAEEGMHASLSAIAPTVQIKLDNTDSWADAQRLAGEATGEEAAAEGAITATEEVLAAQAKRLEPVGDARVAIAFVDGEELVMIPGTEIGGRVFTELGLEVVSPPEGTSGRYSLEQIGELLGDADIIVSFDYGGLETQEANPLFRSLPAVTAGRYVTLTQELATAAYQESSLSLRWAAEPLADAVLEASKGQGRQLA